MTKRWSYIFPRPFQRGRGESQKQGRVGESVPSSWSGSFLI